MRRHYSTLNAHQITAVLCDFVVAQLALTSYKNSLSQNLLAKLLLLVASTRRSLSYIAQRCQGVPSDETVRKALLHYLPGKELLLQRCLAALHTLLPKRLLRKPQPAAADLHLRPFYGDKATPGLRGGQRDKGTKQFWTYATLVLLYRGSRFTVGLCPLQTHQTPSEAIDTLLEQAQAAGVQLRCLLLDRGFYDAAVVAALQKRGIAGIVPMVRRGDRDKQTGTQRFFAADLATGRYAYRWTTQPRRWDEARGKLRKTAAITVSVTVCVVAQGAGHSGLVYACWGPAWPATVVHQRYKSRFGIETSYRQVGQVLAATTSRDERVRLLYFGLAVLLRQVWCVEIYHLGGQPRSRSRQFRLTDLPLWLIVVLAEQLDLVLELTFEHTDHPEPVDPANFMAA